MSVHYIYYLASWNFVVDFRNKNNSVLSLVLNIVLPYKDDFCCNKHAFDKLMCTRYKRHEIVVNEFVKFLCL